MPIYTQTGISPQGALMGIAGLVQHAQFNNQGNLPILNIQNNNNLGQGQSAAIMLNGGNALNALFAFGLITCASVIYVSTSPAHPAIAWVHHAPSGIVYAVDIQNAIQGIGNPPPASILVIYAHPGPNDQGYTDAINTIAQAGILAWNIVEITNLMTIQFGINNHGQISC